MEYLIKVDMEFLEAELEELLEDYLQSKGWELENIEIIDSCEYDDEDIEPNTEYYIYFNVKGHKKWINKTTGEEMTESIGLERKHLQYNFDDETLYGFFEVFSYSSCESLEDGEFIKYMSRKSRGR